MLRSEAMLAIGEDGVLIIVVHDLWENNVLK